LPRRLNLGLVAPTAAAVAATPAVPSASTRTARLSLRDSRAAPIRITRGAVRPTCAYKNPRRRPGPNKEASLADEKDQSDRKNASATTNRERPFSRCATANRRLRADIVYSNLPLLCLSTRSSLATAAACTRVYVRVDVVYAVRGVRRGIRGREYIPMKRGRERERE